MSQVKTVFDWDANKFTTYVDAMDREHKVLVDLMNLLYQENDKGSAKSKLLMIAGQLGQKTTEHFAHEEKYFAGLKNYDKSEVHKKIHHSLLTQYGEHVENFKKSSQPKFGNDFFMFLKVWLAAHICGVDRKYGEIAKAS